MALDNLSHIPHVRNIQAAQNNWDPNHSAIFEVYFTLPARIKKDLNNPQDEVILTEQVVSVSGLDVLQKTAQAGTQKFFGVDMSYSNPSLDTTYAELTIVFNLNLRNVTDNWVLRIFKAWSQICYDVATGQRTLMQEYVCEVLAISEANRNGEVWRNVVFHRGFPVELTGLDQLEYTNNEARKLSVKFRSDWWEEQLADGSEGHSLSSQN